MQKQVERLRNPTDTKAPSTLFLAKDNARVVGRICVGINPSLNEAMNIKEGYFTLFECENSYATAKKLLLQGSAWLGERGIATVRGPETYTQDDNHRGLLVQGFETPPYLGTTYNPPYYQDFFTRFGFVKERDFFAYHLDLTRYPLELHEGVVKRAKERFGVQVRPIGFFTMNKDIADIKTILDRAWPEDWNDLLPPSTDELQKMGKALRFAPRDGILIARVNKEPVGFVLSLPDFNQVLCQKGGPLFSSGILRYLYYRKRITRGRIMALFVVPAFRKKIVAEVLFFTLLAHARKKRIKEAEASIIGETNTVMRQTVENLGGRPYRTYRIYQKNL